MPVCDIRQFIARPDAAGDLLQSDAQADPNAEPSVGAGYYVFP